MNGGGTMMRLKRTETSTRGDIITEKFYEARLESDSSGAKYWLSGTSYVDANNVNRDILTMSNTTVRWQIMDLSE